MAAALKKLAAEYAPLPITDAPFVSAKEKLLEAREQQRLRRWWLAKLGAVVVGAIVALYLFVSFALFRFPSDEALADQAQKTARAVLPLYSSNDQPLQIDQAVAVLSDVFDSHDIRYHAEITLRLREPLYGLATTNGTLVYRMMQESLRLTREQEINLNLFPSNDGPQPPDLPQLIQLLHPAGSPLVVRVPFEAKKFGWKWRIAPAQLANRVAKNFFEGAPLNHFNDAPYFIFGIPETMADVRERTSQARAYIVAISKEIQRRTAGGTAAADLPVVGMTPEASSDPGAGSGAAAAFPPVPSDAAPNSVLLPGVRRPFDPNKPAVAPEKPTKPN